MPRAGRIAAVAHTAVNALRFREKPQRRPTEFPDGSTRGRLTGDDNQDPRDIVRAVPVFATRLGKLGVLKGSKSIGEGEQVVEPWR